METEVQNKIVKREKKNIVLITLAAFILLMLITTATFAYMILQSDKVYKGVHIGNLDASGMSLHGLEQLLDTTYQTPINGLEVTLKTEKEELKAAYPELDVHYDTKAAARDAYAIGRKGSVFDRLFDTAHAGVKGVVLDLPFSYDEGKLEGFVNRFYDMTFIKVKEGAVLIADNNVTIKSGIHGENIDKTKTTEFVKALIEDRKSGIIQPEVIMTSPTKLNVDELYKQISSEPVDASYKMENNTLTLVPHSLGRQIDKTRLTEIAAELDKTENAERKLPVAFTQPNITSDVAATMLFRDELASASSSFATGTVNGKNRGHNMSLAVAKINNMILAPGQEFSYNQVVGPRDLAHGYKLAHVYSAGKIIDGVGGGICQVSSTMYNAILKVDLKVTERRNHSFTVGYVPLGQDATAYYGGTDFRFVNSGKWPVKLLATINGNKVHFSLRGTNDAPGKSIIISNKILKETPFKVKYTDDPTLPVGVTKEVQPGMTGYVVETYKTVKMNDKVVSETKLHTSTYKAYDQVLLRGTKPAAGSNGTAPVTPAKADKPTAPAEVVDEAAPPADGGTNTSGH